MGSYLGYLPLVFSFDPTPDPHDSEIRVESQSEISCCTTSTVIFDDGDGTDGGAANKKRT